MRNLFRDLYWILEHRERWLFVRVIFAVVLMAFLEVVSIGAILPFMGLLTQPDIIYENQWLNLAYTRLGFEDPAQFLLFAGVCLLGIFLFKNVFATFTVWLQLKFSWGVFFSVSTRLLTRYLKMPYEFYLVHNTSKLEKNLVMEVGNTILGAVQPTISLITHSIVTVAILGLLFWSDPVLSLVILGTLGGAYAGIYLAVQKKLARAGADRVKANEERFKAFQDTFGGIKEVKVLHSEDYFIRSFLGPLARYRDHTITHSLISQTPRFAIEALAFGGLLAIILYIVGVREDMRQVIPFASLYAMAGYRLLPSLQQMMAAFTSLRFYEKSVDVVKRDLQAEIERLKSDVPEKPVETTLEFDSRIRIADVSYKYPGQDDFAIDRVSLQIDKNTSVAFVGRSGAGKSTLADIILGLLLPTSGQLMVDEAVVSPSNMRGWQAHIGYVPQHIFLTDDSVTKNIAYGEPPDRIDVEAVHSAAKVANIYDFIANELPDGFDTLVGERGVRLSGGQRQRIAIARALYRDPSVLVFDEATSALDGETETAISKSIRDLTGRKTLILIAHRLQTVKDCDVIFLFEEGKLIAQGDYLALIEESEQFQRLAQGFK